VTGILAEQHLEANRAWALIRDKGQLSLPEDRHLEECETCHIWMTRFVEMAKRAGFQVLLKVPEKKTGAA